MSCNSSVCKMSPAVQNYHWGKLGLDSRVARLLGGQVSASTPYAELWAGCHASAQCKVDGIEVSQWLRTSKGRHFMGRTSTALPFLLKVLSIRQPLSIQTHPDKDLAKRLHSERPEIYKDDNHKPEIALALTDFVALCGFRPLQEISDICASIPQFTTIIGTEAVRGLKRGTEKNLKLAFSLLMKASKTTLNEAINSLIDNIIQLRKEGKERKEYSQLHTLIVELNEQFPGGDAGVLCAYFLNLVTLSPGQCLYIPPNTLHAYIRGDIVECMACSDNVIRGGLTPKFKDVQALLASLKFSHSPPQIIEPSCGSKGELQSWNLPENTHSVINDFKLCKVLSGAPSFVLSRTCMSIGIVLSGAGSVNDVGVNEGSVVVVAAGAVITVDGKVEIYFASDGDELKIAS